MNNTVIATLHFYNNFGSVLQAYALRRTLQRLTDGRVDILPYRPCLPEYEYFQDTFLQEQYRKKCEKFEAFRRQYLGMEQGVDDSLHKEERLAEVMRDYSACVVGSDIVWGREFSGLDPVYFLQPVPEGGRRIAYAASVILDSWGNTEENDVFARYLPQFDSLSLRESANRNNTRKQSTPYDSLDGNLRMFFHLERCHDLYGKLLYFGSGAEYGREHVFDVKSSACNN